MLAQLLTLSAPPKKNLQALMVAICLAEAHHVHVYDGGLGVEHLDYLEIVQLGGDVSTTSHWHPSTHTWFFSFSTE